MCQPMDAGWLSFAKIDDIRMRVLFHYQLDATFSELILIDRTDLFWQTWGAQKTENL